MSISELFFTMFSVVHKCQQWCPRRVYRQEFLEKVRVYGVYSQEMNDNVKKILFITVLHLGIDKKCMFSTFNIHFLSNERTSSREFIQKLKIFKFSFRLVVRAQFIAIHEK